MAAITLSKLHITTTSIIFGLQSSFNTEIISRGFKIIYTLKYLNYHLRLVSWMEAT